MSRTECFFWGCVGSLLPEIIRLWKIVSSGSGTLPDFSVQYFIVAVLYMVFAGLFTIAWNPENPYKAVWVGVSVPAIVTSLTQNLPSAP